MAAADAPELAPPLTRKVRVFYGLGSLANGAYGSLGGMALFFYNQVAGVPAHLVSLALALIIFTDSLWDPVIGYASDHTRTRLGRRHPYISIGAALVPFAMYLRWHPPHGWADPAMFAYVLATGMFVNLAFSLYEVPAGALAPELAPGYHDRTVLLGYRWMFGAFGSGIATILIYGVFLRSTPAHPVGQLNAAGYGPMSYAITAIVLFGILALAFGTHHKVAGLHRPEAQLSRPFREQLRDVFATLNNWNFLVALSAAVVAGLGTGLSGGLTLYFYTYLWELKSADILVLTLLGAPIPILAAIIAPRLSRAWGKKRACMIMFFSAVAIGNTPMLLKLLGVLNLNGTPYLVPFLAVFGLFATTLSIGGYIVVSSMIADIVEEVQVRTGRRSEGLLFTADSIPQKLVNSLAAALPGLLLAWVAFPAHAKPGPEALAMISRLAWVYLPATVVISLISISIWSFYRIDQDAHEANLRRNAGADVPGA